MEYLTLGLFSGAGESSDDILLVKGFRAALDKEVASLSSTEGVTEEPRELDPSSPSPSTKNPALLAKSLLTDYDCLRFIRARNNNIPAAIQMAKNWAVWHVTPLPGQTQSPSTILDIPDKNEHLYRIYTPYSNMGLALDGTPIYWEKTGLASVNFPVFKDILTDEDIIARHVRQQELMLYRMRFLTQKNKERYLDMIEKKKQGGGDGGGMDNEEKQRGKKQSNNTTMKTERSNNDNHNNNNNNNNNSSNKDNDKKDDNDGDAVIRGGKCHLYKDKGNSFIELKREVEEAGLLLIPCDSMDPIDMNDNHDGTPSTSMRPHCGDNDHSNSNHNTLPPPPISIEKQIIVMDMANLVYNLDLRAIAVFQAIAQLDEKYYPERLQHLFIINAPWFFQMIWAVMTPFIPTATVKKFHILGANFLDTLKQYVALEEIPPEYGGGAPEFSWTFPENIDAEIVASFTWTDKSSRSGSCAEGQESSTNNDTANNNDTNNNDTTSNSSSNSNTSSTPSTFLQQCEGKGKKEKEEVEGKSRHDEMIDGNRSGSGSDSVDSVGGVAVTVTGEKTDTVDKGDKGDKGDEVGPIILRWVTFGLM